MFAFRDSAHYYFPLYKYVQDQWRLGVPLWNPLDGLGQPLLGDPTAAVLYPGKLIFCLPLSYSQCLVLYVVLHLWLAGTGAYWCARSWRASVSGALVAGLAYQLSGQVLFQYCNPIFCVGAAWLPWAVLLMDRIAVRRRLVDVLLLALVFCLMVLGGEPQMAYHCGLLGALRIWFAASETRFTSFRLLGAASLLAIGVSAVQVFPTYEWSRRSDRYVRDQPRSAWEWARDSASSGELASFDGMLKQNLRLDSMSHSSKVYDFSVGPWRWNELLWPNISGSLFPINGRWLTAFPGESRMWTPSLYLGLLPIFFALVRFRLSGCSTRVRWLSWGVLISVFAALGEFGLGWCVREVSHLVSHSDVSNTETHPAVGGLYWLFNIALPGYVGFRYPAKWWTIASLGLALLAAKGLPVVRSKETAWSLGRRFACAGIGILVPTIVCAAYSMSNAPANSIFGPLDIASSRWGLAVSVAHTLVVFGVAAIALWKQATRRFLATVLFVCLFDLCLSQQAMIQTQPAADWTMAANGAGDTPNCICRSDPQRLYPDDWKLAPDRERFAALQRCDSATLMPKHHLLSGVRALRPSVSINSADYAAVWDVALERGRKTDDGYGIPDVDSLRFLGADSVIAPRSDFPMLAVAGEELDSEITNDVSAGRFMRLRGRPRVWLASTWEQVPTSTGFTRAALVEATRKAWRPDLRDRAYVEADVALPFPDSSVDAYQAKCELIADQPTRVRIGVQPRRHGVLVLADQFYPGWEVWIQKEDGWHKEHCLRVNRVMRGVLVDKETTAVEFRYRPRSVFVGAIVSILSLTVLLVLLVNATARK